MPSDDRPDLGCEVTRIPLFLIDAELEVRAVRTEDNRRKAFALKCPSVPRDGCHGVSRAHGDAVKKSLRPSMRLGLDFNGREIQDVPHA
jgi:hypothetical protein